MKRHRQRQRDPDILPEYDFSKGRRGKYSDRYAKGSNIVVLDPDVARVFPDQKSVNDTLRIVSNIIRRHRKREPAVAPMASAKQLGSGAQRR